jgi:hypothetical protein
MQLNLQIPRAMVALQTAQPGAATAAQTRPFCFWDVMPIPRRALTAPLWCFSVIERNVTFGHAPSPRRPRRTTLIIVTACG